MIISPLSVTSTVNLPFSYQFEATGGTSLAVDDKALPQGLIFDPALRAIVGNSTIDRNVPNRTERYELVWHNQCHPHLDCPAVSSRRSGDHQCDQRDRSNRKSFQLSSDHKRRQLCGAT